MPHLPCFVYSATPHRWRKSVRSDVRLSTSISVTSEVDSIQRAVPGECKISIFFISDGLVAIIASNLGTDDGTISITIDLVGLIAEMISITAIMLRKVTPIKRAILLFIAAERSMCIRGRGWTSG